MKISLKQYTVVLIISTIAVLSAIAPASATVIPAQAGIQNGSEQYHQDSRLRGNDEDKLDSLSIDLGFTKIDLAVKSVDLNLRAWHSAKSPVQSDDIRRELEFTGHNVDYNNDTPGIGLTFDNDVRIGAYKHSFANFPKDWEWQHGNLNGYAFYVGKSWTALAHRGVKLKLNADLVYGYGQGHVYAWIDGEKQTENLNRPGFEVGNWNLLPTATIAIPTAKRVTTNITLAPGMKSEATLAAMLSASIEI